VLERARRGGAVLWCVAILVLVARTSSAGTITTFLTEFTGDPLTVQLTLDDMSAGAGKIEVSLAVVGGAQADLRGVFMNIADDSLLPGLSVTGDDVTSWDFSGNVIDLGHGSNLNGGGTPCPCDFGIEIGSQGLGSDDIASTSFVLSHDTQALSLSLFAGQGVGVRATSVGVNGNREGSSKTVALIPEPSTAVLLLAGLCAIGAAPRLRSQR